MASGAKTLFELNRGTVVTPRMELMFEGVGRRNFSFTFDFIPKSKEEAKTVNDIVFTNLYGENLGYSKFKYNFEAATRRGTIYPSLDPSIFELKFPDTDIKGRVITY